MSRLNVGADGNIGWQAAHDTLPLGALVDGQHIHSAHHTHDGRSEFQRRTTMLSKSELLERSEEIIDLLAHVITSYGCGEDYIQHFAGLALFHHVKLQQDIRKQLEDVTAEAMSRKSVQKAAE
jgi:hypothetical protein